MNNYYWKIHLKKNQVNNIEYLNIYNIIYNFLYY